MVTFVNAKINIGLRVVRRREDGYHELQTIFYPVGLFAGTPRNPEAFCDILEIVTEPVSEEKGNSFEFISSGRSMDCSLEKNLVYRAAKLYLDEFAVPCLKPVIRLQKHLPDGAGMGGGSADAAFTLKLLRDLLDGPDDVELARLALKLGADCPFFIYNKPAYATGIGEKLEPIALDLSGKWLVVVKPAVSISTKEAFAGISPAEPDFDLRDILSLNPNEWRKFVKNDFEAPFFKSHPEMEAVKQRFYDTGAFYASLTGSGSCIYGIYDNIEDASKAKDCLSAIPTITAAYLLFL